MKSKREYRLFIKDIWDSIGKIEQFVGEMGLDEFIKDDKTYYAVIKCIEIIGEATKNISQSIKKKYPKLDWRKMANMRNKLVHEYFGVDFDILWTVIKKNIPDIKPLVKEVLDDIEKSGSANGKLNNKK